jgi:hypothetical protein
VSASAPIPICVPIMRIIVSPDQDTSDILEK